MNPIDQAQVALVKLPSRDNITDVISIRTQIIHRMSTAGWSLRFQASRSSAQISTTHPEMPDAWYHCYARPRKFP
jgi:hypothetical protein